MHVRVFKCLTIIIKFSSEIASTDNLPIEFLHGLQSRGRVLETHCGCSKERLGLWVTVELNAVDGGDLVADLLEKSALHALVETDDEYVPLRGFPLPELVILDRDLQNNTLSRSQ